MVASRETLQDIAAERQLQPATLERVIRLIDILDAFGADTLIGPRVALKGGTALNVFHSDLDRLSVDIDVNYVGAVEKEQMDADRPGLEDRIERLMESKGYAARREPSEHAGGKWIYRYASALGGAGTIEIDINYLYRGAHIFRRLQRGRVDLTPFQHGVQKRRLAGRELKQRRELLPAFCRDVLDPGHRTAKGIEIPIVQAHGQLAGDVADLASDRLGRGCAPVEALCTRADHQSSRLDLRPVERRHGDNPMRIEQIARGAARDQRDHLAGYDLMDVENRHVRGLKGSDSC